MVFVFMARRKSSHCRDPELGSTFSQPYRIRLALMSVGLKHISHAFPYMLPILSSGDDY